ncbi:MAG: hypothetical protein ACI9W6_001821 [Motiliproteus sp.]|jgi:hypothetical protein
MEIIYPMFALVVLTFVVGFSLGIARFASVIKGDVDRRYFKLLSGYSVPDNLIKLSRNFSNLLEVPVLFYLLCVVVLALDVQNKLMFVLAWLFVALRIVHSVIHITYNNPIHRFLAFLMSSSLVLIMWIKLVMIIG